MFYRAVVSPAKALLPAIRPLLNSTLQKILQRVNQVFPHAEQGLNRKRQQGKVCTTFSTFIVVIVNLLL